MCGNLRGDSLFGTKAKALLPYPLSRFGSTFSSTFGATPVLATITKNRPCQILSVRRVRGRMRDLGRRRIPIIPSPHSPLECRGSATWAGGPGCWGGVPCTRRYRNHRAKRLPRVVERTSQIGKLTRGHVFVRFACSVLLRCFAPMPCVPPSMHVCIVVWVCVCMCVPFLCSVQGRLWACTQT